jgi:hypothetical protein
MRDDLVNLRMEQGLASAEMHHRCAKPGEMVNSPLHQIEKNRIRVAIILVAVGTSEIAAPNRHNLGKDRMSVGQESLPEKANLSPPAVELLQ